MRDNLPLPPTTCDDCGCVIYTDDSPCMCVDEDELIAIGYLHDDFLDRVDIPEDNTQTD